MNFSLKPHPLVAHWVPGMVILMLVVLSYFNWDYDYFTNICAKNVSVASVTILLLTVVAFLSGEFLDTIRDSFIESRFDHFEAKRVEWKYFAYAPREEVDQLCDFYFTYYVLNMNLSLSLFVSLLLGLCGIISPPHCLYPWIFWPIVILAIMIFAYDGIIIREEMAEIIRDRWVDILRLRGMSM